VRVLAIETSASQASVALVQDGQLVMERTHERPKQSAERLLPMIAEVLGEAGWQRNAIDRLGVSIGPGSFTGLRVGIACAQGLSLGLDRELVGVPSLQAMTWRAPDSLGGARCAVLDARRDEVFVAAYLGLQELLAPLALARKTARESIELLLSRPVAWLGSVELLGLTPDCELPGTRAPTAYGVGLVAERLQAATSPALPVYVRDAGATLPVLPAAPRASDIDGP
jgi:tRNA threonylcarbamoyladenosine biosynthesis protein TsaB